MIPLALKAAIAALGATSAVVLIVTGRELILEDQARLMSARPRDWYDDRRRIS